LATHVEAHIPPADMVEPATLMDAISTRTAWATPAFMDLARQLIPIQSSQLSLSSSPLMELPLEL
jgi:hypothetical protein